MKKLSVINSIYLKNYNNWSVADFARHYDLKHQTARHYFETRELPIDLAIKIADEFNISLDYIYRYELTENYLKSRDPGYLKNELEETGSIPEHAQPDMNKLAQKALQDLIDQSVKKALENREEENKSKTA